MNRNERRSRRARAASANAGSVNPGESERGAGATMEVRLYRDGDFDALWPLFEELIRFYEGSDATSRGRVKAYLKDRVLGQGSAMKLALAFAGRSPVGMAAFAVLHPGPKATG